MVDLLVQQPDRSARPARERRFRRGAGDFYGDDSYEGRPIRVHFTWHRLGPDAARWEQEFSADGGVTWELNWVMDFTRTGPAVGSL